MLTNRNTAFKAAQPGPYSLKIVINTITVHLLLFLGLVLAQPQGALSQVGTISDWEDINKTIIALDHVFNEQASDQLSYLVADNSTTSRKAIRNLEEWISKFSISFAYTKETCTKRFLVEDNELGKTNLIVEFSRDTANRHWYIKSSHIDTPGGPERFPAKTLRPLAIEYNFTDFAEIITESKTSEFAGLAPKGTLHPSFFAGRNILVTEDADLLISNIILFRGKKIYNMAYLKISYYPQPNSGNRGWLITDAGYMKEFYKKHMERDPWIDFLVTLSESESPQGSKVHGLDLQKEGPYSFGVVPSPSSISALTAQGHRDKSTSKSKPTNRQLSVDKIQLTRLDWERNFGSIIISLTGTKDLKQLQGYFIDGELRITLEGGLTLSTPLDISENLEARVINNSLTITPSNRHRIDFLDSSVFNIFTEQERQIVVNFIYKKSKR